MLIKALSEKQHNHDSYPHRIDPINATKSTQCFGLQLHRPMATHYSAGASAASGVLAAELRCDRQAETGRSADRDLPVTTNRSEVKSPTGQVCTRPQSWESVSRSWASDGAPRWRRYNKPSRYTSLVRDGCPKPGPMYQEPLDVWHIAAFLRHSRLSLPKRVEDDVPKKSTRILGWGPSRWLAATDTAGMGLE